MDYTDTPPPIADEDKWRKDRRTALIVFAVIGLLLLGEGIMVEVLDPHAWSGWFLIVLGLGYVVVPAYTMRWPKVIQTPWSVTQRIEVAGERTTVFPQCANAMRRAGIYLLGGNQETGRLKGRTGRRFAKPKNWLTVVEMEVAQPEASSGSCEVSIASRSVSGNRALHNAKNVERILRELLD